MKGVVDWQALKDAGIDFAICRTGYGKNGFDETFQQSRRRYLRG